MSQTATIISCGISDSDPNDWSVIVSYLSDQGSVLQAEVFVGPGPAPRPVPLGALLYSMWSSATATISATLPGTANPVLIPVPRLVAWAAFGVPAKGLPFV